ncbi:hypothetical protein RND71_014125 [Anisodus tanguticus]|uniref:Uncharacterized protein n=1 Tax=Anisodus tanguticus TaxID=243964 RepID=A0AAE1SAM5_9SOLA|nr:hypothetical protein RND71_014125 [Anisodus tanguticus]
MRRIQCRKNQLNQRLDALLGATGVLLPVTFPSRLIELPESLTETLTFKTPLYMTKLFENLLLPVFSPLVSVAATQRVEMQFTNVKILSLGLSYKLPLSLYAGNFGKQDAQQNMMVRNCGHARADNCVTRADTSKIETRTNFHQTPEALRDPPNTNQICSPKLQRRGAVLQSRDATL